MQPCKSATDTQDSFNLLSTTFGRSPSIITTMFFLSLFTHVFCLLIFLITRKAVAMESSTPSDVLAMKGLLSTQSRHSESDMLNRHQYEIGTKCLNISRERETRAVHASEVPLKYTSDPVLPQPYGFACVVTSNFEMRAAFKACTIVPLAIIHSATQPDINR